MNKKLFFASLLFFFLTSILFAKETNSQEDENTLKKSINLEEKFGKSFKEVSVLGISEISRNSENDNVVIYFGKDSIVTIKNNEFKNVLSGSNLVFNKDGQIISAYLKINKEGGEYVFGKDGTIRAPANSLLIFKNGKFYLEVPDNTFLEEAINFNLKETNPLYVSGVNVKFSDGFILNKGRIQITPEGIIFNEGEATYKNIRFYGKHFNSDDDILILNPNLLPERISADLQKDLNIIQLKNGNLKIKTSKFGEVILDFIGKNDIFDIKNKDRFSIIIGRGDQLSFEKKEGTLNGVCTRQQRNGITRITNGLNSLSFTETGYFVNIDKLNLNEIRSGRYFSIPLEFKFENKELNSNKFSFNLKNELNVYSLKNGEKVLSFQRRDALEELEKLNTNDLERGIVQIKEITKRYSSSALEDFLPVALQSGWGLEECIEFSKEVVQKGGDSSGEIFQIIPLVLHESSLRKLPKEEVKNLLINSIEKGTIKRVLEIQTSYGSFSEPVKDILSVNQEVLKETPLISDKDLEGVIDKYVQSKWVSMIREDIPEIKKISEEMNVPAEAILSAILVEDIRSYAPDSTSKLTSSYAKCMLRRMIPNSILNAAGHNSNPEEGKSAYGMIWPTSLEGAVDYLKSLKDVDHKTKQILSKNMDSFSEIESVALVIKAHNEYWKRKGYDLFKHNFKTITSFGERIGVLETLNSMYAYRSYPLIDESTGKKVESGFRNQDSSLFGLGAKKEIPNNSPRLGGTVLWGGSKYEATYGKISQVFVDSGLAARLLKSP